MDNYIKLPFILNVAGGCGSGKSYFIQYLIKTLPGFDCIVVISNTAGFTQDYEFLKEMGIKFFIFNSLDAEVKIKTLMALQKKNRLSNTIKNVLLIFDDIFGSIKDSKCFKDLASTFRHYRISIIFSAQYISASATYLREISNYIIIFSQKTTNALKLCYENYFVEDYENFNSFKVGFFKKLKKYHFYFIDRILGKKFIMVCPG